MKIQFSLEKFTLGALLSVLLTFQFACGDASSHSSATQVADAATSATKKAFYTTTFEKHPTVAVMTSLGRSMFMDPSLSASGKVSCASCHSPERAYGPANDLAVQMGGAKMNLQGTRAAPSLRYLQSVPSFSEHFHDDDGDDSIDQGPAGGHTWDGRADTVHDQARLPLLSSLEMANENPAAVVKKIRNAAYASAFRDAFGLDVLDNDEKAFNAALLVLEVFQQSPADFYPYDSKYDAVLRRQAKLSPQEARGLALFNDANKGNCASCHPSTIKGGAFPAFSDFGYIAVGVPRNQKLPANADLNYFDMGLCGPMRKDLSAEKKYCGAFRTPSLRNVALRHRFFHNGAFNSLEDVLRFYVQRDTQPEKWYPRDAKGQVKKFNDLPPAYHPNINMDPPFGQAVGDKPVLNNAEIRDVIAFLKTLTDGYRVEEKAAN
ncbi:cytochrome-c peroxidase [Stenotrophobium rhamnosiphilum]|uniref:Cytochrome-c peroxidase n=1 Tax=Stenotrophobium rhamnosiphilum TaxID=2029166 RepID=A0A2T5MKE4_9GAMM|nr:cytochrome-c peroxidase [Stenotrophobium rhamnosiphilum]